MAPDLENFSTENFSTKKKILSKISNGSIRKVIMLKVKFDDRHEDLPFRRSPWLQSEAIIQKTIVKKSSNQEVEMSRSQEIKKSRSQKVKQSRSQEVKKSSNQEVKKSNNQEVKKSSKQEVKFSRIQEVLLKLRPSPPGRYSSSTSVEGYRSQKIIIVS